MPAPTFYYQYVFRFKSVASSSTTRPCPDDMGLGDYYFGVRLKKQGTVTWYIKTSSYKLGDRDNESLSASITVDVSLAEDGVSYTDCPFFGAGPIDFELVACETAQSTWTTTHTGEIIKLPDITINSVVYVNSGYFTINDWLMASVYSMHFSSTNASYQSSIIHTSADEWDIGTMEDWMNWGVYRGGNWVNPVNPFIDGDELRIWPDDNSGIDRVGQAWVLLGSTVGRYIDIYQDGTAPSSSAYLNDYDDIGLTFDPSCFIYLYVGGTEHYVSWMTSTGLGNSFVNVYMRIWDNTASTGTSWLPIDSHLGTSKDTYWNTNHPTTSAGFIVNGHTYSIDITTEAPS